MTPHFSDPERPALLDFQKLRMEGCWRRGEIGDATFLRSLVFAGEYPADAASRLRMLKSEKRGAEADRLQRSREWLENRR